MASDKPSPQVLLARLRERIASSSPRASVCRVETTESLRVVRRRVHASVAEARLLSGVV
jgi:hypothetical protein